jgi:PAS domain S-box-containing protein
MEEISEEKQTETKLAASQSCLSTLFEISPDVIYGLSAADGAFTTISPAFERITGWRCSEWISRKFSNLLHPDDVAIAVDRFHKVLSGDKPRLLELRLRTKGGAYLYMEVISERQIDEGRPVGLLGFARDITRRKKAEQRLQIEYIVTRILAESVTIGEASHRILRAVCDTLEWDRGELWTMDRQAHALRCGETWQASTQRFVHFDASARQASVSGNEPFLALVHGSGRPVAITNLETLPNYGRAAAAAQDGLRSAIAFPIKTEDEGLAVIAFFSVEIRPPQKELLQTVAAIGGQIGLFIQRKRAEEGLRASERRFLAFVNNTAVVAWIKDQEFRYVFINRTFEEQLGLTPAKILGKTDFDLWPENVAEEFRRNDEAVFRSGTMLQIYESIPNVDGKLRYYRVFKFQFRDASERRFVGGIAVDITERMEAEEALRRLPQRIVEAEEQERRRVARELHDSVSQLLSSARFRLQAIASEAGPTIAGDLEKTIDLLRRALQEVRIISHNLLPSELDDLGLIPAIRSACDDLKERTGIRTKVRCSKIQERLPKEVELTCYRILQEALSNVEKHANASLVELTLSQKNSLLHMRIRDNGKGMSGPRAVRRKEKKSGLGLLTMRERAAVVGGTLVVKSMPRAGTEIIACIPTS